MKKYGLLVFLFATAAIAATTYTTNYQLAKPGDGDKNYGQLLRGNFDTIDTQLKVNADSVTNHLNDTSDAHDATAISTTGGPFVCTTSTTVQQYLDCLDGILDPSVSGVVLITGAQDIAGEKTFEAETIFEGNVDFQSTIETPINSAEVLGTDSDGVVQAKTFDDIDPLTTKGDILVYESSSDRLPVGTNNQVLMADSAESSGLVWHSLVKADVGLENVDNTSDATKNSAAVTLANKTISSPTVTGTLLLQNPSGSQPELRLSEDPDNGTNYLTHKAPATLAGDFTFTWPADDGASGEVLTTDGNGVLTWSAAATLPVSLTTGVSGVLPIANGGTNSSTAQTAINTLAGGVTDNRVLRGDGTNVALGQIDDPAFFTSGALATSGAGGTVEPYSTNGVVYAGTYTPIATNVSNLGTVTPNVAQYMRVGDVVTVSGTVSVDPTTSGTLTTEFTLSLPVVRVSGNFNATSQAGGSSVSQTGSTINAFGISSTSGSAVVTFANGTISHSGAVGYPYTFTYRLTN